jgi:glycosyltransferase involved in cell wall biosynthesis
MGLKGKNFTRIPIAINDVFYSSNYSPSERSYILFVGRIDRFKGIDALVKAIAELKLSGFSMKCIIVGQDAGYRSKLELLIEKLQVSDLIEIRDRISQENLVNLYSGAFLTVLPSLSEGFPLTIVESMATGTPFIATPVGVLPDIVNQSTAGILVPLDDPKTLAQMILSLIKNKALWSEMSTNGKKFADNFRWDTIAQRYYELYLGLVHKS